jgi:hypothetical protein
MDTRCAASGIKLELSGKLVTQQGLGIDQEDSRGLFFSALEDRPNRDMFKLRLLSVAASAD